MKSFAGSALIPGLRGQGFCEGSKTYMLQDVKAKPAGVIKKKEAEGHLSPDDLAKPGGKSKAPTY